jgi:large subunit ribosomal protein L21
MNTVVEISGKQYQVKIGDVITVDKLEKNENDSVVFENVLMLNAESNTEIGNPYLQNVKVEAKVLKHVKDKKVIVFKYKSKKNERRIRGHRQNYTILKIENISKK